MVDQNIDQHSTDSVNSVENALSLLWDKVREASLVISTLREEKKQLLKQIEDLQEDVEHLKNADLQNKATIDRLEVDLHADADAKRNGMMLDLEEKRILQQKIRNTIVKIDQYLTP